MNPRFNSATAPNRDQLPLLRSARSSLLLAITVAAGAAAQPPGSRFVTNSQPDTTAFVRVRARMDSLVSAGTVPSVAVAVAKGGRIVWEAAAGLADRERGIRATPETIYPVASVAKSITATAVMLLLERGLVRLDEPVHTYLARDLVLAHRSDPREVTPRTLLNMTAGIPHLYHHYWRDEPADTLSEAELVRRYGFSAFEPGRHFHYSNMSYGVLQHLITRTSGKPFARFVREEVFGPLGLQNSAVYLDDGLSARAAKLYMEGVDGAVRYRLLDPEGGAWFLSSVRDLALFGSALTFAGPERVGFRRKRVLSDETVRQMLDFGPLGFYGFGWWGARQGSFLIAIADGQAVGTTASVKVLPENDVIGVALTNQAVGNEITLSLVDDLVGAVVPEYAARKPRDLEIPEQFRPRPFVATPEWSGGWAGHIKTHDGDAPVTLTIHPSGSAIMQVNNSPAVPLQSPMVVNGMMEANVQAELSTPATSGIAHRLELNLRLERGKIFGYVLAASTVARPRFGLPFYIALTRVEMAPGPPPAN
jgi:CubicO group peptidase (beta-lactamase class C family)